MTNTTFTGWQPGKTGNSMNKEELCEVLALAHLALLQAEARTAHKASAKYLHFVNSDVCEVDFADVAAQCEIALNALQAGK